MRTDLYVCDTCQKESKDYMGDKWLVVERLTKYGGRKKDKTAFTTLFIGSEQLPRHFCAWKCLTNAKTK